MNYSIDTGLQDILNKASYPYRLAVPNMFYTRSVILDILAKKARQTKHTLAHGDLGTDNKTNVFETFYGRDVEVPLYLGSASSSSTIQSTKTNIFVTDGDEINPEQKDSSNIWGKFQAVDIGASMIITKAERQKMEQYIKNKTVEGVKNLLDAKWNTWLEEKMYMLADNIYNGGGYSATPRPQLEGLTKLYDTSYAYGLTSADFTAFPNWTPWVWNLQNAATGNAVLGYTSSSLFATRADLISTTSSATANVPKIIDVLRRAVQQLAAYNGGVKPDLILTRRSMMNIVNDANLSLNYNPEMGKKAEELAALGYPDTISINGVPIVADDTTYLRPESKTIQYAIGDGTFYFIYLKDFFFKVNDLDNFKLSGWTDVPMRYGLLMNTLTATCVFGNSRRDRAAVLYMPTAFSSDGY